VQQRVLIYDKSGEEHYNLISALHKSVRNSDPDAALYWLARMFAAGEDPLYLARRVVRMAVEDIGLAAPEALNLTLSAKEAIDFLGSPEGDLALAEAVVYLCSRPSRTRSTPPTAPCSARSKRPARSRCRCTCATRPQS
jgi:putative ATPase